jgi:hypothetical protein
MLPLESIVAAAAAAAAAAAGRAIWSTSLLLLEAPSH